MEKKEVKVAPAVEQEKEIADEELDQASGGRALAH